MKVCSSCKIEKDDLSFYKDKSSKSGLRSNCKDCNKKYKIENSEKIREYSILYREKNNERYKEYYKKYKEYYVKYKEEINLRRKEYYKKYKEEINLRRKEYYKNSKNREKSEFEKLSHCLRNSVYNAFKRNGYKKSSKTYEIIGISFEEFKLYIESKFEDWMTWENRGLYNGELNYGWDIDHIIPLSSAETEEDIIQLNHYTNLQPLCGYTNRHIKRDCREDATTEL